MDPRFVTLLKPFLRFLGDAPLAPDSALRALGLDSMKAIDLLFAIEDEFEVVLPDMLMNDTTFETAATLWHAVRSCLDGSCAAAVGMP
jgi:acyl carrier protein